MSTKDKKKGQFKKKLTAKYRLVVLNEDTFEERFSLKLSRLKSKGRKIEEATGIDDGSSEHKLFSVSPG